jgi:flagellar operon protein
VSVGLANPALGRVGPVPPATVIAPPPASARVLAGAVGGPRFADVLAARSVGAQPPSFSKHALERVARRGIQLSQQTLARLAGGVSRAAGKGSRNAVIFVDHTAFVVSVPNNTVITAVDAEHMREHVFTNIDSAVFA